MKKLLLFTFLFGICFPSYSYATGVCLIKDKSAQVLLDYIKNNRQVIKNVTRTIVEEKNKYYKDKQKERDREKTFIENQFSLIKESLNDTEEDLISSMSQTARIFNEMFNFTGYYSYFNYFVTFQISNEVPFQVKRDYKILDKENEGLIEYIKKIDNRNNAQVIVENACRGIIEGLDKCKSELNGLTSKEIIGKLIQNNDTILDLYRTTVIGEVKEFEFKNFILIDNNFILEIKKNYGTQSMNACNKEKGGFFEQITTTIKEIKALNKVGEDGIKEWQNAWQLLIGNNLEQESIIEDKELKRHLSNQGISTRNQEIMLNNSEKYNSDGFDLNNNFLSNTFLSIKRKITEELEEWEKEIFTDFLDKKENKEKEKFNINQILKSKKNSEITKNIEERIANLYENEIPFAAIGDITTENLRAKIIDTHFSLENSINTLEKTIVISQKVCKSQDGSKGNCE